MVAAASVVSTCRRSPDPTSRIFSFLESGPLLASLQWRSKFIAGENPHQLTDPKPSIQLVQNTKGRQFDKLQSAGCVNSVLYQFVLTDMTSMESRKKREGKGRDEEYESKRPRIEADSVSDNDTSLDIQDLKEYSQYDGMFLNKAHPLL